MQVEGEEVFEDGCVGEIGGPAVGGGYGGVQRDVEVGEPGGTLVVEVGQGALFQFRFRGVGWVEPTFAEFVQESGGVADGGSLFVGGFGKGKVSKQVVGV